MTLLMVLCSMVVVCLLIGGSLLVYASFFVGNHGERMHNKHLVWWVPSSTCITYFWYFLVTYEGLHGIIK